MRRLVVCFLLVLWASCPRAIAQTSSAQTLFESDRQALMQQGVFRRGDFLISTVHLSAPGERNSTKDARVLSKGELIAIGNLIESRIRVSLQLGQLTSTVQSAVARIAPSCIEGPQDFAGTQRLYSEIEGNKAIVVIAVPAKAVDSIQLTTKELLDCLSNRILAGTASEPEVLTLIEILPDNDPRTIAIQAAARLSLASIYGDGITTTLNSAWTLPTGKAAVDGLHLWRAAAQSSIVKGNVLDFSLPSENASISDIDELFSILGHRMGDASILARIQKALQRDGWSKTALLFRANELPIAIVKDIGSSKVPQPLRAKLAATPLITLLLISNGQAPLNWSTNPPAHYVMASAAFAKGSQEDLVKAVELLQMDLAENPNVEAMNLLAASLLALDDPTIARPTAAAAFRHEPSHRYAGINLLNAEKALGNRTDTVRTLLKDVKAQANPSPWGSEQFAKLERWLSDAQSK